MATEKKKHSIHRFATERKKDGHKVVKYAFSCTPCNVHGAEFDSKNAREKAIAEHGATRKR